MLAINMDDVINVLNSCKTYMIALGIALAIAKKENRNYCNCGMHEIKKTGKETGEKGSMDRIPYGSSCDYQPDLLYSNVKYDLTCNGKWYDHRGNLK